jgi:galactose-1-phosphate uridylyltransferase
MDTEKLKEEFKELCKPLNEWLQKNYHPHTRIIIENDHAEIVEGVMGIPFEVLG